MKKNKIITAIVIMIISAATFANAEEITIDFDGRTSKGGSFAGSYSSVPFEELMKTAQGNGLPEPMYCTTLKLNNFFPVY